MSRLRYIKLCPNNRTLIHKRVIINKIMMFRDGDHKVGDRVTKLQGPVERAF